MGRKMSTSATAEISREDTEITRELMAAMKKVIKKSTPEQLAQKSIVELFEATVKVLCEERRKQAAQLTLFN
jgi:hypothetical protein